jgi:hypothetical protein
MRYLDVLLIAILAGWALWANRDIHTSSVRRSMARRKKSWFSAWF